MAYKINDTCIGCGACVGECPVDSIKEGTPYEIDAATCIDCGACAAGFGGDVIDFMTGAGYKGIVVEAFGRGNVHPETAAAMERAMEASVVVAVCSRCYRGRVLGVYCYSGGGVELFDKGAISAGDMAGNKIRIMLMACLGAGMNRDQISELFRDL